MKNNAYYVKVRVILFPFGSNHHPLKSYYPNLATVSHLDAQHLSSIDYLPIKAGIIIFFSNNQTNNFSSSKQIGKKRK